MSISAHAYLVESIPKGLEDLRATPGVAYTEDVLVQLTSRAKSSIDLTAMYWALLADPGSDDEKGFTPEELDAMGAGAGRALYEALRAAAQRGVRIRILQSPGFFGHKQESDALQADFPDRISIHSVEMGKWYGGGGIMHQKVWIFDRRHLYLGSTNMDWKSITQVKEMGVVVEDCPELAADAGKYFEAWWAFAALSPTSVQVFDPVARIDRRVPPWSILVPAEQRAKSTLAGGEVCDRVQLEGAALPGPRRGAGDRLPHRLPARGPRFGADLGPGRAGPHHRRRAQIHMRQCDGFRPGRTLRPPEGRRDAGQRRRHSVRHAGMVVEPVRCASLGGADPQGLCPAAGQQMGPHFRPDRSLLGRAAEGSRRRARGSLHDRGPARD